MTADAADGRLLQRFVPELEKLRITDTHEQLPLTELSDGAPVWLKTAGRQLEILARFEVAGNCSFGLHVLASKPALAEFTTIGVDITDDLTFVDRMNSSGANPLVPNRGLLDVRAGLLPPDHSSSSDGTRTIAIHVIVDGPIVTFIVSNETALSVYVYPQLQSLDQEQWWRGAMVEWHGRRCDSARECRRVAATQRVRVTVVKHHTRASAFCHPPVVVVAGGCPSG